MKLLIITDDFAEINKIKKRFVNTQCIIDILVDLSIIEQQLSKNMYEMVIVKDNNNLQFCLDKINYSLPIMIVTEFQNRDLILKTYGRKIAEISYLPMSFSELHFKLMHFKNKSCENNNISYLGFRLNCLTNNVEYDNKQIQLTIMQRKLLVTVLKTKGKYVSREIIHNQLYDQYQDKKTSAVRNHVFELNKNLKQLNIPFQIKCDRSLGYYLCHHQ